MARKIQFRESYRIVRDGPIRQHGSTKSEGTGETEGEGCAIACVALLVLSVLASAAYGVLKAVVEITGG